MSDPALLRAGKVVLRAATPDDRQMIFDWLFRSDVTPTMLGPPLYPERPIPPPGEPGEGYDPCYFDGSAPELGRCYLVLLNGDPVGQVNHNDIHERGGHKRVELDIWMRSDAWCGKGYGTDALNVLCRHLHREAIRSRGIPGSTVGPQPEGGPGLRESRVRAARHPH